MKKLSGLTAAILSILLLLTACGTNGGNAAVPSPVSTTPASTATPAPTPEPSHSASAEPEEQIVPIGLGRSEKYLSEWDQNSSALLCRASYPQLSLLEASADAYPALAAALDEFNSDMENSVQDIYDMLLESVNDELSLGVDIPDPYYSNTIIEVKRADSKVLSLLGSDCVFLGGVHPNTGYYSAVFDTSSGKRLSLDDVLADASKLPEVLKKCLEEKYGDAIYADLDQFLAEHYASGSESDRIWTLDVRGITFYFNPYDLAPYAYGMLCVNIPFSDMPELFREEYTVSSDAYAISLSDRTSLIYDLDGDSKNEDISIYALSDYSESGYYNSLNISIGDSVVSSDDYYAYSFEAYLMHTEDARSYLYIDSTADNDYHFVTVYDLSRGTAELVGTADNCGLHAFSDGAGQLTCIIPTDPGHFALDSRMNVLSTSAGSRIYHIGADGMPEAETEYYDLHGYVTLTSKQVLAVSIVDRSGNVTQKDVDIPSGSTFSLLRTDGSSYVDAKLSDGRECRLNVDVSAWPQTVNGISLEDCFDGIVFAG